MKIKIILLAILVALVGNTLWNYLSLDERYFKLTCESNLHYNDNSPDKDFFFNGTIIFDFEKTRKGYFYLTGKVGNTENSYDFSRYVNFEYYNEDSNRYNLKITKIQTMGHDNVPESFVPLVYAKLNISDKHSLYIARNDHGILTLGTIVSPLLSCVIQD